MEEPPTVDEDDKAEAARLAWKKLFQPRDPVAAPRKAIRGRPPRRVKAPIEEIGISSIAVGEEDEYKHGKVVDVVESDSFNGVYFQCYNHKRCPVQPTKDAMEQTACTEFPSWKKRGSDFVRDPQN